MRQWMIVLVAAVLVAALVATAFAATDLFIQDRQMQQLRSVPQKEASILAACQLIVARGDELNAIKAAWEADVAAGELTQATVDKLVERLADLPALYTAAKTYRDAHQ